MRGIMDGLDLASAEMVMQYGFAGFALVLLGVVVWLVKRFLATEERMITAISELTNSINNNGDTNRKVLYKVEEMNNQLQRKPCIAKKD